MFALSPVVLSLHFDPVFLEFLRSKLVLLLCGADEYDNDTIYVYSFVFDSRGSVVFLGVFFRTC